MSITHKAFAESEHFSYESFGSGDASARVTLLAGLQEHVRQMDIDPAWAHEMLEAACVHEIGPGCATFQGFDDKTATTVLPIDPDAGPIAYRSHVEFKCPDRGWGYVEGYGCDKTHADDTVMRALAIMGAPSPDEDGIEGDPIREGGAYRGGAVQSKGEPLLDRAIAPTLPAHCAKWLPTIRLDIRLADARGLIAEEQVVSRPSRQNTRSVIGFGEATMYPAIAPSLIAPTPTPKSGWR